MTPEIPVPSRSTRRLPQQGSRGRSRPTTRSARRWPGASICWIAGDGDLHVRPARRALAEWRPGRAARWRRSRPGMHRHPRSVRREIERLSAGSIFPIAEGARHDHEARSSPRADEPETFSMAATIDVGALSAEELALNSIPIRASTAQNWRDARAACSRRTSTPRKPLRRTAKTRKPQDGGECRRAALKKAIFGAGSRYCPATSCGNATGRAKPMSETMTERSGFPSMPWAAITGPTWCFPALVRVARAPTRHRAS